MPDHAGISKKSICKKGYVMLKDNLILLRKMRGLPQETVAEAVGISRQAYAKWEKGISVPDIE